MGQQIERGPREATLEEEEEEDRREINCQVVPSTSPSFFTLPFLPLADNGGGGGGSISEERKRKKRGGRGGGGGDGSLSPFPSTPSPQE